ncbi:MAG: glycosyltransferase family 2 protein [Bacteroidota bacterium]|nr:glycosyltransferase family 2 protein [Bacteroidota bacterium]
MTEKKEHKKNKHILISVAMATCNGEKFISRQIDSILTQTVQPAEIIVCDDASTDHTLSILKQYEVKGLIKLYSNEKRLGVINNFKKAVSLTSADNYIALSDQDDIWFPEKLEQTQQQLIKIDTGTHPCIVYSDMMMIDENEKHINFSFLNELGLDKYQHSLITLLYANFVAGCTVLMNIKMRELFATIPNSKSFNHDTWIALIAFSMGKAKKLSNPYMLYRKHTHNVSFANHRKKNRLLKVVDHLKSAFVQNGFLDDQIVLVKEFYKYFKEDLPEDNRKIIQQFLRQENKSSIKRKIAFELVFRDKWIKRF